MATDLPGFGFEEFKARIQSSTGDERAGWVQRFVAHFLDPDNETLRRIARREFYEQLRPLYTVEDVLSRVGEKLERRLRTGKLALLSEKKFLGYVTRMIQLTLMDINRLQRLQMTTRDPVAAGGEGQGDLPARGKGPSTQVLEKEDAARLHQILRDLLHPDEWYLIRRYYFEGASYEQIADEILPPEPGPPSAERRDNRCNTIRMWIARV